MPIEIEHTNQRYTLFHDESNNFRKLKLLGSKYNIDNDPDKEIPPIFVLAGIAYKGEVRELNFEGLKAAMFPNPKSSERQAGELKFSQMGKIPARYSPRAAFKAVLASEKMNKFFQWLLDNDLFIHCKMINVVYWVFLDIVEDLILCANNLEAFENQFHFKDYLYRLIKLDKANFLELMDKFNYPKIEKDSAISFLEGIYALINSNIARLYVEDKDSDDIQKLLRLNLFIFKCMKIKSDDLEFTLVYDLKVGILQSDFSFFYMARIKTFPKSNQTLDEEKDVKEKFADEYYESELAGLEYRFVVSKEKENYAIQISDVVAAFFKHYYAFIEASDISEVRSFREGLTPMQRGNLNLFSQLIDKSTDECKLFLHRVIVPQDEVKAAILFQF